MIKPVNRNQVNQHFKCSSVKMIRMHWSLDSFLCGAAEQWCVSLTRGGMKDSAGSDAKLVAKRPSLFPCPFSNVRLSHAAHSATLLNFCTSSQGRDDDEGVVRNAQSLGIYRSGSVSGALWAKCHHC